MIYFCFLMLVFHETDVGGDRPSAIGPVRSFAVYTANDLAALRAAYGRNKTIPAAYELPALLALAHYPQLADAQIDFVVADVRTPIASRPAIGSLFGRRRNRVYRIVISESSHWAGSPVLVRNMSLDAQVGALGHELGHTVFYMRKSFCGLLGVGFRFLSRKYRIRFERDTDVRAIDHGLGWQLLAWSSEIRGGRHADNPMSWLDRYYLSPEKIEEYMATRDDYGPSGGR